RRPIAGIAARVAVLRQEVDQRRVVTRGDLQPLDKLKLQAPLALRQADDRAHLKRQHQPQRADGERRSEAPQAVDTERQPDRGGRPQRQQVAAGRIEEAGEQEDHQKDAKRQPDPPFGAQANGRALSETLRQREQEIDQQDQQKRQKQQVLDGQREALRRRLSQPVQRRKAQPQQAQRAIPNADRSAERRPVAGEQVEQRFPV